MQHDIANFEISISGPSLRDPVEVASDDELIIYIHQREHGMPSLSFEIDGTVEGEDLIIEIRDAAGRVLLSRKSKR